MSLTEPVALGLVASLARPGGNITGVTYSVDADIFGKQLELLKEVVPKVRRVDVLTNPAVPRPSTHPEQRQGRRPIARATASAP